MKIFKQWAKFLSIKQVIKILLYYFIQYCFSLHLSCCNLIPTSFSFLSFFAITILSWAVSSVILTHTLSTSSDTKDWTAPLRASQFNTASVIASVATSLDSALKALKRISWEISKHNLALNLIKETIINWLKLLHTQLKVNCIYFYHSLFLISKVSLFH